MVAQLLICHMATSPARKSAHAHSFTAVAACTPGCSSACSRGLLQQRACLRATYILVDHQGAHVLLHDLRSPDGQLFYQYLLQLP